jgi:hypothetical protein
VERGVGGGDKGKLGRGREEGGEEMGEDTEKMQY